MRLRRGTLFGLLLSALSLSLGVMPSLSQRLVAGEPSATAVESTDEEPIATLEEQADRVIVRLGGEVFTEYLIRSGAKPVLWPVLGPSGLEMTRAYPLRPTAGPNEKEDHIHQRSLWFTHGDVNGISFWHEQDAHGTIVHREFSELTEGESATITSINDWLGPDGVKVCEDQRRFRFGSSDGMRWIDVAVTVTASEGEVIFGDTKEGSFGVRVAGPITVDEKLGGRIESSEGLVDGEAWGKPARWVDYSGPIGDQTAGITILNHPTSYGYPSHWHVRTYGLFAANPFGLHDFYGADSGKNGDLKLAKGESFQLRYRVLLHEGGLDVEKTHAIFEAWVSEDRGR